jgi:hypothetical protein
MVHLHRRNRPLGPSGRSAGPRPPLASWQSGSSPGLPRGGSGCPGGGVGRAPCRPSAGCPERCWCPRSGSLRPAGHRDYGGVGGLQGPPCRGAEATRRGGQDGHTAVKWLGRLLQLRLGRREMQLACVMDRSSWSAVCPVPETRGRPRSPSRRSACASGRPFARGPGPQRGPRSCLISDEGLVQAVDAETRSHDYDEIILMTGSQDGSWLARTLQLDPQAAAPLGGEAHRLHHGRHQAR